MSREDQNKPSSGRWFTSSGVRTCDLGIVDELAAPDMLLQYSCTGATSRTGRHQGFHDEFPQGVFRSRSPGCSLSRPRRATMWSAAGKPVEPSDRPAFGDFLAGSLPANTGRNRHYGTTFEAETRQDHEEIGLDDGVTALQQLGLIAACRQPNDNHKAGLPDCCLEGRRRQYVRAIVQCRSPSQWRPRRCSRNGWIFS